MRPHFPRVDPISPGLKGKMVTMVHELAHIVKDARDEGHGGHNVRDNENPFRGQIGLGPRRGYSGVSVDGLPAF
jgi:hypothetical protein